MGEAQDAHVAQPECDHGIGQWFASSGAGALAGSVVPTSAAICAIAWLAIANSPATRAAPAAGAWLSCVAHANAPVCPSTS